MQRSQIGLDSMDNLSRRIRQSAEVASSRLGDAGVLVHLQTNRIFEVNATALRIWELAADGRRLDEIEQTLRREFDVAPERLRSELLALVGELSREGLIHDDDAH
jgi:Coenzyme PQQ synthesis protein D (PqqD)